MREENIDITHAGDDLAKAYEKGYEDSKPKWIPVGERLPDNSIHNVLCCGARGGMFVGWVAKHVDNGKATAFVHGGSGRSITHWMPLPEPPKDGET